MGNYRFWVKFGFILYLLICLLIFAYLKFPYATVVPKIEHALSKHIKKDVAIESIRPVLPFGVRIKGIVIQGEPVCKEVIARPVLRSLLMARIGIGIKAMTAQGSAKVFLEKSLSRSGIIKVNADMENIDVSVLGKIFPQSKIPVKGRFTGTFAFNAPSQKLYKGEGDAHLVGKQGSIPSFTKELPFIEIAFSTLTLDAHMEQSIISLDKMMIKGERISSTLKGTVRLAKQFSYSMLDLKGDLALPEDIAHMLKNGDVFDKGSIHFVVQGKMGSPQFRVVSGIKD